MIIHKKGQPIRFQMRLIMVHSSIVRASKGPMSPESIPSSSTDSTGEAINFDLSTFDVT